MDNNATSTGTGYLVKVSDEVWERSIRGVLSSVFFGMRYAIAQMLDQGTGGSIVNIASVDGLLGATTLGPYDAGKAGVINLTRTAALEYGRHGIRVNSVCPGGVATRSLRGFAEKVGNDFLGRIADAHALGRVIEPIEIANVVVFLASDESSCITGATIVADAGQTIGTNLRMYPPYPGRRSSDANKEPA
jgi:NAD(P)-dependent dehydrogenase (short-subunit alcohol dehydrogenase family)